MSVDVADFASAPRIPSNAIRQFRRIPRPDLARSEFVELLRSFIQEGRHDMLIPTDDQTLAALTEHYGDFKDILHVACPPPEVTRLVLNKSSTLEVARKCGIRVPKTLLVSSSAQLLDLVGRFPFPWIVKPAEKETCVEETKSFTFATAAEVAKIFPTAREFTPPMLLQEYCAGAGVGVEMLMHQGNCLAVFQHRRLKELPYTGGYSVSAVAERPDPALVESSLALLRALRWEGVAMVEFKVNPTDGSAVLMEVNGRYWGTIGLPIFAGINFPLYHWQLVHGDTPSVPDTYAAGARWQWTAGHVRRCHGLLVDAAKHSQVARKELLDSLQFAFPVGPSICHSVFSSTDPLPAILDLLGTFKFFMVSDLKALRGRVAPSH